MPKPIALIKVPNIILEQARLNISDIWESLQERMQDYHILCTSTKEEEISVECFYEKDYKEKDIQDLKKYVTELINADSHT
jgi:hypothetical protein